MKIFRLALILTLMLFFRQASGAYLHMRHGLHYQQHLSLEETAAILDIPFGTAKSRLSYGVATVRKFLEEKGRI